MSFEGRKVDRHLASGRAGIGECMRESLGGNVRHSHSFAGPCYSRSEC